MRAACGSQARRTGLWMAHWLLEQGAAPFETAKERGSGMDVVALLGTGKMPLESLWRQLVA